MLRVFVILSGTVLLASTHVLAQTSADSDVTISTDRPSVANSSVVVPRGGLQAENGFLATDAHGQYILDFPETYLRYGLLDKTELRLTVPDYYHGSSAQSTISGFGDTAIGVKQQLGPLSGFDLSAIVFLSLPTGAMMCPVTATIRACNFPGPEACPRTGPRRVRWLSIGPRCPARAISPRRRHSCWTGN